MKYEFTKMHGIGNDYIFFNCFDMQINNPQKLSVILSDRHFGIGSDGIILILKSDICDIKMRMFNSDGSEGKMCGNGIRCVSKYVIDKGLVDKDKNEITIETLSGIKKAVVYKNNNIVDEVTINMGKPSFKTKDIGVLSDKEELLNYSILVDNKEYIISCVSMGNPHAVIFCDDIDSIDVEGKGKEIQNMEIFPNGVNVEFAEFIDNDTIKMRVCERGSGETLACGTGACSVCSICYKMGIFNKDKAITVKLRGGDLKIKNVNDDIIMTGKATLVYEGNIEVEDNYDK